MTPLSIGVVGAGQISRKVHLPILRAMPQVRVAWIVDRQAERAAALSKSFDIPLALAADALTVPPCDVALLAIPVQSRNDYLREFAARGAAVLCEKPFATGQQAHRQILELFSPSRLGCGYMRRFYGSVMVTRKILSEDWFGPLRKLSIREGNRSRGSGINASFLDDPNVGTARGVLTDYGSHSLDLALYLTDAVGFEIVSCNAVMDDGIDRKLSARVKLTTKQRDRSVDFDYCVSWLDRQANIVHLTFERCSIWFPTFPSATVFLGDPRRPSDCIALSAHSAGASTFNQAFYLEWEAFLTGVRQDTESVVSAHSAVLTTALLEQLLQVAR